MTSTQSWKLWQRLPPRYQLTSNYIDDLDDSESMVGSALTTPRSARSTRERQASARNGRTTPSTMTMPSEPTSNSQRQVSHTNIRRFSFPARKSGYVTNYKSQQRVTSGRISMANDPSATVVYTSTPRMNSAPTGSTNVGVVSSLPSFPVTRMNTNRTSFFDVGKMENMENSSKSTYYHTSGPDGSKTGDVRDVFPFDDKQALISHPGTFEHAQKRYVVQDMPGATMYIDNGKIIYVRKPRHDPTRLLMAASCLSTSRRDEGSYIAGLRQEYLQHPKCWSGRLKGKTERSSTPQEKLVERERHDYDQRIGHILDYYTTEDQDKLSIADLARYTRLRTPNDSRAATPQQTRTPRSGRIRRLLCSPPPTTPKMSPRKENLQHYTYNYMDDCNPYLKVNSQSVLHDRRFYLRTPGINTVLPGSQNIVEADLDNCKCGFCRIEMQLSLMAQMGRKTSEHPHARPCTPETEVKHSHRKEAKQLHVTPVEGVSAADEVNTSTDTQVNSVQNVDINKEQHQSPEDKSLSEMSASSHDPQTLTVTLPEILEEREPSTADMTEEISTKPE